MNVFSSRNKSCLFQFPWLMKRDFNHPPKWLEKGVLREQQNKFCKNLLELGRDLKGYPQVSGTLIVKS